MKYPVQRKHFKKQFLHKKSHFFFGKYSTGFLVFNKSRSNLFLTLLDFNKKVIIAKTSGSSKVGNSKRKKLSTQAIDI
jgi:ribosomal protein S11